ncbi:MAG: hypothetical protein KH034_02330 [Lachnospiraceae bacterium]|nr:hypothetical protein [Lachnospiraceae bacterium]
MKRFTQYLYEYRQSEKVKNIGFVKVEQGRDGGRIQIQTRGLFFSPTEKLKVYLFYEKNGMYEGILQGEIGKNKPLMQYILTFSSEEIGNEVCGIFLEDREKKRYMAVWNGETINADTISTEHLKEIEIQESDRRGNFCEKIQRKDLVRLPRREWKLANNNFLLHGFYNYHHLLWIEEDNELYIGVPGVNHAREVQAARAFGFTQFRKMENGEGELTEEERNPREDFGYFCRRIKKNE